MFFKGALPPAIWFLFTIPLNLPLVYAPGSISETQYSTVTKNMDSKARLLGFKYHLSPLLDM